MIPWPWRPGPLLVRAMFIMPAGLHLKLDLLDFCDAAVLSCALPAWLLGGNASADATANFACLDASELGLAAACDVSCAGLGTAIAAMRLACSEVANASSCSRSWSAMRLSLIMLLVQARAQGLEGTPA